VAGLGAVKLADESTNGRREGSAVRLDDKVISAYRGVNRLPPMPFQVARV